MRSVIKDGILGKVATQQFLNANFSVPSPLSLRRSWGLTPFSSETQGPTKILFDPARRLLTLVFFEGLVRCPSLLAGQERLDWGSSFALNKASSSKLFARLSTSFSFSLYSNIALKIHPTPCCASLFFLLMFFSLFSLVLPAGFSNCFVLLTPKHTTIVGLGLDDGTSFSKRIYATLMQHPLRSFYLPVLPPPFPFPSCSESEAISKCNES